ncbi:hypothetical protein BH11PSE8_BH11PSE8_09580 [soil metagenome]
MTNTFTDFRAAAPGRSEQGPSLPDGRSAYAATGVLS